MLTLAVLPIVLVILFVLCRSQDEAMDSERKFWVDAGEVFENH